MYPAMPINSMRDDAKRDCVLVGSRSFHLMLNDFSYAQLVLKIHSILA